MSDFEKEKLEALKNIVRELAFIGIMLSLAVVLFCYFVRDMKSELKAAMQDPVHAGSVSDGELPSHSQN
jgi:hypothetical protein